MSKKIWTASLIALVLVVAVAGAAMASSGDEKPGNPPKPGDSRHGDRPPLLVGEVTAIGEEEFTLLTRNDVEITVLVDDETRYFGDLESFADLEVGLKVGVAGRRQGDQTVLAKGIASADDFPRARRARGEVIDVGALSLTIETRSGESLTFIVNDETRFFSRDGEVEGLSDISEGDHVGVLFVEADNGALLAKGIGVGGPKPDGDKPDGAGQNAPEGDQQG